MAHGIFSLILFCTVKRSQIVPKTAKKLTEQNYRNAKPKSKNWKMYDGEGLYLLIRKSGSKAWQYEYSYKTKRRTHTIGQFIDRKDDPRHVSLKEARYKRHELRVLLDKGDDPSALKRRQSSSNYNSDISFELLAREWHSKGVWVPKHAKNILRSLENDAFPIIGDYSIESITKHQLIEIFNNIEKRGAYDVAKRVCQRCSDIFEYAIGKGLCDDNPTLGRSKYIQSPDRKNRPHLKEHEMGEFLYKLDDYHGRNYIATAVKLLAYNFVRPGELRKARWEHFDKESRTLTIPPQNEKMNRIHIVPLADQSMALLDALHQITGSSIYLFPGIRDFKKPISDVTLSKVLKIIGYNGDKVVPHGFRHTASTILNEYDHNADHIEKSLSHKSANTVRSVYNKADYLSQRSVMMQWYADHLDKLKAIYINEQQRQRVPE